MPIQDTPIQQPETGMQDTPIKQIDVSMHSPETEGMMAAQSSFLDSYVTGNAVLDNYRYYSGVIDKAQELRRLAKDKAEADSADVQEEFILNPYGVSGSIEEQATAVQGALQQVLEQGADPDLQAMQSMMGDSTDFEAAGTEAARSKMFKILADAKADVSLGDELLDFGKALLPFVSTYEGYHLSGDILGQDEQIKKAIMAFRNMPAEEQASIFPTLRDHLVETMGEVGGIETLENFLAPLGAERSQRYGDVDTLFDAIDLTGAGMALGAAFQGIRKSFNIAKSMKAMGNEQGAADATIAALGDPELARAANISEDTALGNSMPFDVSLEDGGHTMGISGRILEDLRPYFREADQTAEDIIAGNGFLKEGILNTRERAAVEAATIAKLKAEKAENIRIVDQDLNETRFAYEVRDEDGNVSEEVFDMAVTLDDTGAWAQSEFSLIGEYLASPSALARGNLREDVDTAQRLDYLSSRINAQLHNLTREALRPIGLFPTKKNRASLARVDKALIEGDEWKNVETGKRGKVFTVDELRSNYGLDDNEVSAYYRINRLYNNLFNIRNHEKRQEMVALGYKNVNFSRSDEAAAAKVFENAQDAALSVRGRDINYVYDADADELINVKKDTDGAFSGLYDQDKVIVRMEEPYDIGGGRGKVYYTAVARDEVSELPEVVLQRKEGYVPRAYENNVYFVKEFFDEVVDGDKVHKNKKTLRFFDNRKEADEFVERMVARDVAEGISEDAARAKYRALEDREEEILSAATGDIGHGSGGLYTGARAQDEILFGLNGTKPTRLNSFESLTRNIGNLSRFASINQWRLGMEQKWINTANRIFSAKGVNQKIEGFSRLPSISEASEEVRFLNKMYDQIRDWQNFPTAEERAWSSSVQKVYDWAANRGYKKTAKLVGNLRGTDPIATARATAFHSLLGWFNPAQLWVQAQGMANAFALGLGKYAARSQGNMLAFTAMDLVGDKASSVAKAMAKAAGTSDDEFKKLYELWGKTGYRDSVLQTADHAAAAKGYGLSREVFRQATERGLVFYRNGELLNRRLSFLTAVERWKEKNPGKTAEDITDNILKDVMDDANNMMLNMTKANRAAWQKGVLSLPTQFLQVTTKFLETAGGFNKNFDAGERGRMMAAQLLMYGTAGVPLVGYFTQLATQGMGITQQDIENNPGIAKAWNDGMWGAATYWIMGADIEISSRGSLLRGVTDFVDNWFVQESTVTDKLLGAFGSTGTRFWDSFVYHMRPFTLGNMDSINWEDGAKLLTVPFIQTISTFNNVEKAMYMNRLNAIYSRNGRAVDTHDFSFTEELAKAIGFQPTREAETWDLAQMNEASESMKRKVTDYVLRRMNEFAFKYPNGGYSEQELREYEMDISAAMGVLDPDESGDVNRSIHQSLTSGSRRTRETQIALRNISENSTAELNSWRAALLGSKVLRLGLEPEEE